METSCAVVHQPAGLVRPTIYFHPCTSAVHHSLESSIFKHLHPSSARPLSLLFAVAADTVGALRLECNTSKAFAYDFKSSVPQSNTPMLVEVLSRFITWISVTTANLKYHTAEDY